MIEAASTVSWRNMRIEVITNFFPFPSSHSLSILLLLSAFIADTKTFAEINTNGQYLFPLKKTPEISLLLRGAS